MFRTLEEYFNAVEKRVQARVKALAKYHKKEKRRKENAKKGR